MLTPGNAQGDATLAGATYGIFRDGELIDTYTTGSDGSFMTRYYVCGDGWTIREIEPSTGYLLNETIYEVGASPSQYEVELNTTENQVTETVIYGNIQLVKHTDDLDPDVPEDENTDDSNAGIIERPEAGAVFEVYLKAAGSYDAARKVNVTFLPRMRMVLLPVNRFLMGIIRSIRSQARKAKPLSRTLRYSFPLTERLIAIF